MTYDGQYEIFDGDAPAYSVNKNGVIVVYGEDGGDDLYIDSALMLDAVYGAAPGVLLDWIEVNLGNEDFRDLVSETDWYQTQMNDAYNEGLDT